MTRAAAGSGARADADIQSTSVVKFQETALYSPVKTFLEAQGFDVKGEVCGCDVVAVRDGEPKLVVITELKLSFTLELVLQAVDRLRAADQVYLAVAGSRRGRDQDSRVHRLCRLLGVGLLTVDIRRGAVTVVVEPLPYRPRANLPLRRRLLKEHASRRGDPTRGGSTQQPIMTAYRQRAIACAEALQAGPLRPRDLKALAEDSGAILRRNVYGWFDRIKPGIYGLSALGIRSFPPPMNSVADEPHHGDAPTSDPELAEHPGRLALEPLHSLKFGVNIMTEATWGGEALTPEIDWRMSASLENVHRGDTDLAEVTSLRGAVRAWQQLDPEHQAAATLTPEHPIQIDGVSTAAFSGAAIAALVEQLRSGAVDDTDGPAAA